MLMKTKRGFLHSIGFLTCPKTYKARFIANSSSRTTTELSKLLTSCLTTITKKNKKKKKKKHVIKYCEKVYERSGKNLFWSIKNSCEVFNKLKSQGFLHTIFLHHTLPCPTILFWINKALFILHVMIRMPLYI